MDGIFKNLRAWRDVLEVIKCVSTVIKHRDCAMCHIVADWIYDMLMWITLMIFSSDTLSDNFWCAPENGCDL